MRLKILDKKFFSIIKNSKGFSVYYMQQKNKDNFFAIYFNQIVLKNFVKLFFKY